jgi:hypothetical protein
VKRFLLYFRVGVLFGGAVTRLLVRLSCDRLASYVAATFDIALAAPSRHSASQEDGTGAIPGRQAPHVVHAAYRMRARTGRRTPVSSLGLRSEAEEEDIERASAGQRSAAEINGISERPCQDGIAAPVHHDPPTAGTARAPEHL